MTSNERILVVGSGGREHALAWRLAQDAEVEWVGVLPGNDGMARSFERASIRDTDVAGVVAHAKGVGATLVVVGPEAPLAAGLVDALTAAGIAAYGPTAAAARLESSKWFAKQLMAEAGVPTARAEVFDDAEAAILGLDRFAPPWVLKADGLAAGKGVLVTGDREAANAFARGCLQGRRFGESGLRLVIEEHLAGEEASMLAVCDGERWVLLPPARDYKRAYDGDRGANTGGMGAFAPAPAVDERVEALVGERVVGPVLAAMRARGTPFRGTLYAGLMLTAQGPRVLEFNARFGDPETEVQLPLVRGSLTRLLASAARGALDPGAITRDEGACVGVAIVDEAYPDASRGGTLEGLEAIERDAGVTVFHAGTAWRDGGWIVQGGRAAFVVARGPGLGEARERAYAAIDRLGGHGWRVRSDIAGAFAVARTPGAMTEPPKAAEVRP